MPNRSQEHPTQASSPSTQEMEAHPPAPHPSVNAHGTSHSALELPTGCSEWGLATYTHNRGHDPETRSFSFRDEQVRSIGFNAGYPLDHEQDRQSNCTSFDGCDNIQSPDHVRHCYTNTSMDNSAQVFNGDIARAYDASSTREHHLHGGSVKNKSRLVNGDLDRDTFLAIFCNPNDEARLEGGRRGGGRREGGRREGGRREEARPRRRGSRMEG
ncbi:hypothetical protein N7537_011296 [Penicillium hordei]|uniref:Uncharacterized protein n=1 Tax=Penicillium hordei TaxID=40994 RepID=A0AAD6DLG6_9EURO|nr:uncharacterized protein N7537_011296 [Penicillium hordei]KAJ5588618.1 hypothetical protein N7537_011296 [Penicillium hordei]